MRAPWDQKRTSTFAALRSAATTVPFEEARPQIEQVLTRRMTGQALEAKVAELKKTAKVEVLF